MQLHNWLVCCMGAWLAIHSNASAACISDTDNDGVCDGFDVCPGTIPGAAVDSTGCPLPIPGDWDHDADVDLDDLALLTDCWSGPNIVASDSCLSGDFDADLDLDVDMTDFAIFQRCYSGENQAADPGCAGHLVRIQGGCLHIIGTAANTSLALRLQPGSPAILEIDVGNDGTADFSYDRSEFNCIVVDARGGNDLVWIDEVHGVFTDTELTTIRGGEGNDTLLGGSGPETFEGGPGNDTAYLGAGNDQFVWNPGDDTDVIEGNDGVDTIVVNGSDEAEQFTIIANGIRVRFDRISPAPFFLDIGTSENLVLNANGGNDTLSCTGNLSSLIQITADGGADDDTLLGGNGNDVLLGGNGNDFIDGNQGIDLVFLGAGDDIFQWDPGDGSDTVEGQAGTDVLVFNGSGANEIFDLSANGQRVNLFRNVGTVFIDADGIEQIDLQTFGGADSVTVNDLSGTDLAEVNIDLAGPGGIGDAQADSVIIAGTPAADVFNISADAGFVVVDLAADVRVKGYEVADQVVVDGVGGDVVNVNGSAGPDTITLTANGTQARVDVTGYSAAVAVSGALSLTINALGGQDTISCAGNLAGLLIPFTLDGGEGDDTISGSNAGDVLIGGNGNDFIDGNQGIDLVFLGAGDDIFQWDPGDGSDTVEGQAGTDVLVFNGSGANEIFDLSANGQRVNLFRNVGTVFIDADGIEQIDLQTFGGADSVTVNDLSGTDLAEVNIDLAGPGGIGDTQADSVIVNGTDSADTINITANAGAVNVSGLAAQVLITHSESALDSLTVNGLGGLDTITPGPGVTALIMLTINQ